MRDRGGRAIIDLHVHRGAPLRLLEDATTVRGLGLRDFEHTAAFLRLRRWLERPGRGVAIDDGWGHEAPRHEERARIARGELRDTSGGWDEWSARAVVIWRLARR